MQQWLDLQPAAAFASSERAVRLLEPGADSARHVSTLIYVGMLRMNFDREQAALARATPRWRWLNESRRNRSWRRR